MTGGSDRSSSLRDRGASCAVQGFRLLEYGPFCDVPMNAMGHHPFRDDGPIRVEEGFVYYECLVRFGRRLEKLAGDRAADLIVAQLGFMRRMNEPVDVPALVAIFDSGTQNCGDDDFRLPSASNR